MNRARKNTLVAPVADEGLSVGLVDLGDSLSAAQDLLQGVDALLLADQAGWRQRSARALLGHALDLVAQAAELAQAMQG